MSSRDHNPLAEYPLRYLEMWADMRVISSARYIEERDRRIAEEMVNTLDQALAEGNDP